MDKMSEQKNTSLWFIIRVTHSIPTRTEKQFTTLLTLSCVEFCDWKPLLVRFEVQPCVSRWTRANPKNDLKTLHTCTRSNSRTKKDISNTLTRANYDIQLKQQ